MLKIAKTEFYKLKRYSVVWIGVATMLTVVLLTRFMATASDGAVHTLEYFSNSVIWNNFSLIFPATITLIAGYIIERERVDDTLKNILTIPIPFRKLLAGKLIAVGGLAIILAAIEFVFTMIIFFISRWFFKRFFCFKKLGWYTRRFHFFRSSFDTFYRWNRTHRNPGHGSHCFDFYIVFCILL